MKDKYSTQKNYLRQCLDNQIKSMLCEGVDVYIDIDEFEAFNNNYIAVVVYTKSSFYTFDEARENKCICFYMKVFYAKRFKLKDSVVKEIIKFLNKNKCKNNTIYLLKYIYLLINFKYLRDKYLSKKQSRFVFIVKVIAIVLAHAIFVLNTLFKFFVLFSVRFN